MPLYAKVYFLLRIALIMWICQYIRKCVSWATANMTNHLFILHQKYMWFMSWRKNSICAPHLSKEYLTHWILNLWNKNATKVREWNKFFIFHACIACQFNYIKITIQPTVDCFLFMPCKKSINCQLYFWI